MIGNDRTAVRVGKLAHRLYDLIADEAEGEADGFGLLCNFVWFLTNPELDPDGFCHTSSECRVLALGISELWARRRTGALRRRRRAAAHAARGRGR